MPEPSRAPVGMWYSVQRLTTVTSSPSRWSGASYSGSIMNRFSSFSAPGLSRVGLLPVPGITP